MKKALFLLTSILIFSSCSTPAEESVAPEATADTSLVDSSALETAEADSSEVK